jgi:hypothetical protein
MQPRPAEVEWAVNQAIRQTLHADFPLPALSGGGRVPAQVMLGILAQESNFWQASRYSVPGVPGNPLIGNYFGVDRFSSSEDAWYQINYPAADCGYGIAQVTTGMETGEMPYYKQLAIATDYKANISRGLQILIEKWNQTRDAGLIINDGNPKYLENWFYAIWAYNTGFYPQAITGQPWGVGWLNNPMNTIYPANRASFLDGNPADAAVPYLWPYPERVLGFAANSVQFLDSVDQQPLKDVFNYTSAFTPAWWRASDGADGAINRREVKPPIDLFCDPSNSCMPSITTGQGPCQHQEAGVYDFKCWYNQPATWKADCELTCGYEDLSYDLGEAKPSGASSFPANCSRSPLPSNALVIDNLPNGTPSKRPGCTAEPSDGSFQFSFAGAAQQYPSKIDLHQLGSGYNGQFYFTHVRVPGTPAAEGGVLDVTGTWTLGQSLSTWAKVYVHMPNHGAWTQQASYVINTGLTTVTRSVNQRNYANEWVSLGTLQISGTPTITLANNSARYSNVELEAALSGTDDIAWDAVAFVPTAKPTEFVVALGDSYSSGEGTSPTDGSEFFRGSDHNGPKTMNADGVYGNTTQNSCHRSFDAWAYGIDPPRITGTQTVRQLVKATNGDQNKIDFQLLACSGAETKNVRLGTDPEADNKFGELTQLDRGFIDANTTLVTMSIGGNDVGFSPVISTCVNGTFSPTPAACKDRPAPATLGSGTLEQAVNTRLATLQSKVQAILTQIHTKAPNARIVLLGYPTLFESSAMCVFVPDTDRPWLNSLAARVNSELTKIAYSAGAHVTYQSPQYRFTGRNLCTTNSGINGLVFQLTPGDSPMAEYTGPGPNFGFPLSAQSIHPNDAGSALYSQVANSAVRSDRTPLSSSLVGGATTTYYSTFRLHDGGPINMNVSSFSSCGQEIRFGLRQNDGTGVFGQQHTDTLSWTVPHAMQAFTWTKTSPQTKSLPVGMYALNGRLVSACAGGAAQPWTAELYLCVEITSDNDGCRPGD